MNEILNDHYEDSCGMSLLARDQYEREVAWFEVEPLSSEEEKKYLDRIWRARLDPSNGWRTRLAKDARERLTEHYQPLLRRIVAGYARLFRGVDFLDLVQEANIALLQAFDTWSSDEHGTFVGWMIGCVRVSLKSLYRFKGGVRFDRRVREGFIGIAQVEQRYLEVFGRSPTSRELSFELGLSLSRVYELLHYRCLWSFESVEVICGRYEVPEDYCCFQEMYHSFSDEEVARSDATSLRVEQALSRLSLRRCEVLRLRYGLCGESSHTEEEVGDLLGIKVNTVNATASAGRKGLRVVLAPLYEGEEVAV